jgi:acyl-coenzyme A thioesterase PaaI-like protein
MSVDTSSREVPVPDAGCFGCSPTNPGGLRLRFFKRGDAVTTTFRIPDRLHGAPAIAHGGIVATILDEVSCVTGLAVRGVFFLTGELSIRYDWPCPVETDLAATARIVETRPRYVIIEAELRQGERIVARSTGKFFPHDRSENAP